MYKNILITGGAGFVGSNLAIGLVKHYKKTNIIALDNLKRLGSQLNIPRLENAGIKFVHGDVRNKEDLAMLEKIDLIIECSAEPAVSAGIDSSPEYVINTNLIGTINCLELARKDSADIIFLSTSRIYSMDEINKIKVKVGKERFIISDSQKIQGVSDRGIREDFPLGKTRSLYGATKLASEFLIQEYIKIYKIKGVINRCGIITGPWQMGKVNQGVVALWVSRHYFQKPLKYIGYGGSGKQVRDFVHIDDLLELVKIQINNLGKYNSKVYNVGGGLKNSFSLVELTKACEEATGNKIHITQVKKEGRNDIKIYLSDCTKIKKETNWTPKIGLRETVSDIASWIKENESQLKNILG